MRREEAEIVNVGDKFGNYVVDATIVCTDHLKGYGVDDPVALHLCL